MKNFRLIPILLLLSLFLSACSGLFPTVQPEVEQASEQQVSQPEADSDAVEPAGQGSSSEEPTEAIQADPVEPTEETAAEPTAASVSPTDPPAATEPVVIKQGLSASDPESVSLASGEVQLVEFFAFW